MLQRKIIVVKITHSLLPPIYSSTFLLSFKFYFIFVFLFPTFFMWDRRPRFPVLVFYASRGEVASSSSHPAGISKHLVTLQCHHTCLLGSCNLYVRVWIYIRVLRPKKTWEIEQSYWSRGIFGICGVHTLGSMTIEAMKVEQPYWSRAYMELKEFTLGSKVKARKMEVALMWRDFLAKSC